jgi:hypothetical protein
MLELSRLLVEVSVALAPRLINVANSLRDAAAAYKLETEAIPLEVEQSDRQIQQVGQTVSGDSGTSEGPRRWPHHCATC